MPAQLSTILYISDYKEKTSGQFFVGTASGQTRLEEEEDSVQTFNITVFYPLEEDKPCYIPRLQPDQVISVANSKFSCGTGNTIDLVVTAATVLKNVKPEDLPVHPINVVATALVADSPTVSATNTRFDCIVTEYLSKSKIVDVPITCYHPPGSRLANQTITVKRGSFVFVSGTLTSIEGQLYLELHNFSFVRSQGGSSATKTSSEMPWSGGNNSPSPKRSIAHSIHQAQEQQPTNSPAKRKASSKFPAKKMSKLSDIATQALDSDPSNSSKVPETTEDNAMTEDVVTNKDK